MANDVDDLLGDVTPRRRVGRPTKEEAAAKAAARAEAEGGHARLPRMEEFYKPVGVTFLADVFRLDTRTAKKKLAKCPTMGFERGGVPVYDFVQAAGFLIPPQVDMATWIKSQRIQDLPPHLSPAVWQAMRHKQAYERDAGDLWPTDSVLEVFGETFLLIKNRMQLWADTLAENTVLSDDQRTRLVEMVDALQDEIHRGLVEMPKKKRTPSSLAALEEEVERMQAPAGFAEDDEDDLLG